MTNELGVTRQDIESWTKQSVANEIEKLIGQMNVGELVANAINKSAEAAVNGGRYSPSGKALREQLAKELASRIQLSIPACTPPTTRDIT